jgi:hypothetical protein
MIIERIAKVTAVLIFIAMAAMTARWIWMAFQ